MGAKGDEQTSGGTTLKSRKIRGLTVVRAGLYLPSCMRFRVLGLLVVGVGLVGCDDPFAILPASRPNTVDTLELFAVNGTGLNRPSGYALATKGLLRLGIDPPPVLNAPPFDFMYRIDAAGPQFAPFGAVAPLTANQTESGRPGLQTTPTAFDAIKEGQQIGYSVDKAITLTPRLVLFARSALPNNCFLGIPYYAKIEVLEVVDSTRSIKFRILTNNNCGYRGLEPGIPTR